MAELSIAAGSGLAVAQPVVISLLGSFHITVDGQPVHRFRSNKVRALLAYLVMAHPHPLLRTTLTELLWPDYNEESARVNLRQTLASLRENLSPYELLFTDRNHVQFAIKPVNVWCDALLVDELLDTCHNHYHRSLAQCPVCQERLQQILALYRGPFLENFPNIDSPPFARWLQTQRTYFADRLAEVQKNRSVSNQQRSRLPLPLTPLIGRTQEITELVPRLRHTIYRCVSLVGPGGIGKTRLACAVGEQVQADFPDGVWLVPLGALAPTTAAEIPEQLHDRIATAIAMTVGCRLHGAAHPTDQVAAYLADKTALLILDSFEHLTSGAAWLPTVLAAAPHLRLLITTRHRLPLQSQLVYPVGGLGVPPESSAVSASVNHLIAQYASLQLFVERAESAQMLLSLDTATVAIVSRLCRFVEGSPWAIEVAVSMLAQHTPATLLVAIQTNYRLLATDLLDVPARQRSAEAVFLAAWALLSPPEAQLLARCAVFRGGFTLAAAQQVASAMPDMLEALVQKSLLQQTDAERYAMHDLVRQFAEEQLARHAAGYQQSRTAHATYFTALLATWQPDDVIEQPFLRAVTQDWDNVQAAWNWASVTGQVALLQQGLAGLVEFYESMGLYLEVERTLGAAIAQVRLYQESTLSRRPEAAPNAAAVQRLLAHLLWRRSRFLSIAFGQLAEAQQLAEEVLVYGAELADDALRAWGCYTLACVALQQGDYRRQQQLIEQALTLAEPLADPYAQAHYLMHLGISCKMQRDYAAAQNAFEQGLRLVQKVGSSRLELLILSNVGSFHWDAGNFTEAQSYLRQGLQRAQAMEQKDSATVATACLGALAVTLGDYRNGRAYLAEAQQGYVALGHQTMAAQMLNALAALALEVGDLATATEYTQRVLASPVMTIYQIQYEVLINQGHLRRIAADWAAARTAYTAAYTLSQQHSELAEQLPAQAHLAALDLAQGDVTAALRAIEPVLSHFATTTFATGQRPQELLLIAYEILVANADPRATSVLRQAWRYVQEQAAKIDDVRLRESFLTQVPVNRDLARLVASNG